MSTVQFYIGLCYIIFIAPLTFLKCAIDDGNTRKAVHINNYLKNNIIETKLINDKQTENIYVNYSKFVSIKNIL